MTQQRYTHVDVVVDDNGEETSFRYTPSSQGPLMFRAMVVFLANQSATELADKTIRRIEFAPAPEEPSDG